jgi:anti-sigma factor RsiW
VTACLELDGLLAQRAAGDLAPDDAARLDDHLASCERCRRELEAYREVLSLARLPAEPIRPDELSVATLSAYRRARRRRVTGFTLGAGVAAAVVAAGVILTPALLTLRSLPSHRPAAALHATDGSAQLAGPGDATSDDLTLEDVALAAFDEADAP